MSSQQAHTIGCDGYPAHWSEVQVAAYRLVHEYRDGKSRGSAALAPMLGKSASLLSNEVNPDYPSAKFGLDDAVAAELAADQYPILQAHAAATGHVCHRLPAPDLTICDTELLSLFAEWQSAMGVTCQAIREALSDGRITYSESRSIQSAGNRHMMRFMEFLSRLYRIAEAD